MNRKHTVPVIRRLTQNDRKSWRPLWLGYHKFYRSRIADDQTERAFAMLTGEASNIFGLVAEKDDELIGFAHCVLHPSTWLAADSCYLQDLFVDSNARGLGAGRALIEAVYCEADETASGQVYWMTQEFNADARALYDSMAVRTSFIQYQRA